MGFLLTGNSSFGWPLFCLSGVPFGGGGTPNILTPGLTVRLQSYFMLRNHSWRCSSDLICCQGLNLDWLQCKSNVLPALLWLWPLVNIFFRRIINQNMFLLPDFFFFLETLWWKNCFLFWVWHEIRDHWAHLEKLVFDSFQYCCISSIGRLMFISFVSIFSANRSVLLVHGNVLK